MSWVVKNSAYDVILNGQHVAITGEITQTEGLDQDYSTCEIQLASYLETLLKSGDPVQVWYADRNTGKAMMQFVGQVHHRTGVSYPNSVSFVCNDSLAALMTPRHSPDADLPLAGMTDQAVVQAVLSYVGLSYTSSDIQGTGYVLGAKSPLFWRRDQAAQELVSELDRVFGYKTMLVGNRPIRIPITLAPPTSAIQFTYIRGQNANFSGNQRDLGDRTAIRNLWNVTGGSFPCGDNCDCTVWARASDYNPVLGAGVRIPDSESSDLIQDERLAYLIAQKRMRTSNREPDVLVIETVNDLRVRPGTIVGVVDTSYGIGLTSPSPYTVTQVVRTTHSMSLTCIGGAPGDIGTITTGTDQRCNQTSIDIPGWGGDIDFDLPDFDVPPFPIEFDWEPPVLDVGSGGFFAVPNISFDICTVEAEKRGWSCGSTDISTAASWTTTDGSILDV